jgi:hypothetical protein
MTQGLDESLSDFRFGRRLPSYFAWGCFRYFTGAAATRLDALPEGAWAARPSLQQHGAPEEIRTPDP